ncbi:MAG: carbohydrate kinase family protein, partial [Verrucomicrobia bacterium]|nr:carbohydrate kinase family protein [Verrucomicrobiota bacterium]
RWLVEQFAGRSFMLANLGNTQLNFGIEFWEPMLVRMNSLQLSVRELRTLFAASGMEAKSLAWMLDWLRDRRITTVVTAGKFGAVGSYQDGCGGICIAGGTNLEVVDPTGAGDAFASGFVAEILARGKFGIEDFCAAMSSGRAWAAFACMTVGGSGPAPSRSFLDRLLFADGDMRVVRVENPAIAPATMAAIENALF